jgi:hypothetical protein
MVDSMLLDELKTLKPHNLWIQKLHTAAHWKAKIYIYSLKKFQKIYMHLQFIAICPKY